jgi:hypothetical protein
METTVVTIESTLLVPAQVDRWIPATSKMAVVSLKMIAASAVRDRSVEMFESDLAVRGSEASVFSDL